jgi:hypothetical protein
MKKSIGLIRIRNVNEISKVERFIEELCDYYNVGNEYFGNILLAVDEAMNLFMRYRKDDREIISLEVIKIYNGLKIEIKYTKNSIIDNDFADDIANAIKMNTFSKETYIIKSLTDSFKINEDASGAELIFLTQSYDYEKSLRRVMKLKEYMEKASAMAGRRDE